MKHNYKTLYIKLTGILGGLLIAFFCQILMVITGIIVGLIIVPKYIISDYNNNDIWTFLWNIWLEGLEAISWVPG